MTQHYTVILVTCCRQQTRQESVCGTLLQRPLASLVPGHWSVAENQCRASFSKGLSEETPGALALTHVMMSHSGRMQISQTYFTSHNHSRKVTKKEVHLIFNKLFIV